MADANPKPALPAQVPVETPQHDGGSRALRGMFSMTPRNLTEAIEFSKLMAASEVVPMAYIGKPADILVAVQMGTELGLSPINSLNSICVIKGRPTMWGDAVKGLVDHAGVLEEFEERDAGDALAAKEGYCRVKRRGQPPCNKNEKYQCLAQLAGVNGVCCTVRKFTVAQAEAAGLYARSDGQKEGAKHGAGPWQTYPGRMLQMRARSWALRDTCADVLKGLWIREEAEDIKDAEIVGGVPGAPPMPRRQAPQNIIDVPLVQKGAAEEALRDMKTGMPPTKTNSGSSGGGKPAGPALSWKGTIDKVTQTSSKPDAAKQWTKYTVHSREPRGEAFSTFDKDTASRAMRFAQTGELALIEFTVGQYGKDIVKLSDADQPPAETAFQEEPGANG